MLHEMFDQDWQLVIFYAKYWFMWNKKFVQVLNYLKNFKAVLKNNPWTNSLQQNEKAVFTTAGYFKVSTPVYKYGRRDS